MARIRVKVNSRAARDLLNSAEVQEDLLRRAEAIKAGADSSLPADAEPYVADVQPGSSRAHAMVKTSDYGNRRHTAKTNALLKNLDRGSG